MAHRIYKPVNLCEQLPATLRADSGFRIPDTLSSHPARIPTAMLAAPAESQVITGIAKKVTAHHILDTLPLIASQRCSRRPRRFRGERKGRTAHRASRPATVPTRPVDAVAPCVVGAKVLARAGIEPATGRPVRAVPRSSTDLSRRKLDFMTPSVRFQRSGDQSPPALRWIGRSGCWGQSSDCARHSLGRAGQIGRSAQPIWI